MNIKFHFDAISPYAFLAWRPLKEIAKKHKLVIEPVSTLFAGLLNANGQLFNWVRLKYRESGFG